MSKWELSKEKEINIKLIVEAFIADESEDIIDLSGTGVAYYHLGKILESLGYIKFEEDVNGWEMDMYITYEKEGFETLSISGNAIIFEIKLSKE